MKYPDGKFAMDGREMVNEMKTKLIRQIYGTNWQLAYRYLTKIDNNAYPKLYDELFNLVYSQAILEYTSRIKSSKTLNHQKDFDRARRDMEKAISIINQFPNTKLSDEKDKCLGNLGIISKKIQSESKLKDINREITVKTDELKRNLEENNIPVSNIKARIVSKKSDGLYIANLLKNKTVVALRLSEDDLRKGDLVDNSFYYSGKISIDNSDEEIPLYTELSKIGVEIAPFGFSEKERITQRIEYLKSQKHYLDSLISLKF